MKQTYDKINRALIKRLELLPNIFEFTTEKYGIHEYAAVYGIEKVLRRTTAVKLLKSKPNFYLERQHRRLVTYAANGQGVEYDYLSQIILKKSKSFRILALNRTIKDWFVIPIRDLRRIWRSLCHISETESSDLRFKRVWIDKKPGDYARPLGVPTPAWRAYSFMWMDHLEKFQKASGRLQSWQHGGRSGVGVLSCYKMLIPRLLSENTIYEFDIKGFFDNISHEVIIKRFKESMGNRVSTWISQILKSKPTKYVLPPVEIQEARKDAFGKGPGGEIYATQHRWDLLTLREDEMTDAMLYRAMNEPAPREIRAVTVTVHLSDGTSYDKVITASQDKQRPYDGPAQDWLKGLSDPYKGVPQGLGTSPFISTFLTDTYLYELGNDYKALIMYMDDGILFASCKAEMERLIKRLKELLGAMGLEIAPEKSKYVKVDGKWLDSIRFLGLRYLPESNTFMSDTRSGTQIEFPAIAEWDNIAYMAKANCSSVSGMRQKFDKLINTQAYEAGLKYGFLGCLIAGSQYKDNLSMEERKAAIRTGQAHAWTILEESRGFLWKNHDLVNYTGNLTNASSIACHNFAEFNRKGNKLFCRPRGSRRNLLSSKRRK